MSDLAKRLTETEREQRWANVRPRDAATLILIDQRGGKPHVLMGRRDKSLKFMPGMFVFPGGRVDRADRFVPHTGEIDPASNKRLLTDMKGRVSESRARALALAAIRETYEETGIMLGKMEKADKSPGGEWDGFLSHGVTPDLSAVTLIARAITPPRRPRRFDTRFFAATTDSIGHQLPFEDRPHHELGELQWIALEDAASLEVPTITTVMLEEVAQRLQKDGGLTPKAAVPYYFMRNKKFLRTEI